jgi:DUF917 family protein
MKKLTLDNLEDLAVGSAILGSGGGGDPTYAFMMAKYEMERRGLVSLVNFSELNADDLILSVGFIGAPLAEIEKIPSGREFFSLFEVLEKTMGKKVNAVMPFEIGGANAFTPISVAAQLGLPLVDADTMGRAFPEVQMSSCHLLDGLPSPGFITDCLGNTLAIYPNNSHALEKFLRQIAVTMGSTAAFGLYPLSRKQVEKCTVLKSISKAIAIGKSHREAKKNGKDPLEAVLNVCKGVHIGSGKVVDIYREISKGFLKGLVTIQNKSEKIELFFQNEFLLAKCNGKIVATTPDILMLLEQETGFPITSETLQYGLKTNLIALPAPSIWTIANGLALVGPRQFGYDVDYQPISKRNKSLRF